MTKSRSALFVLRAVLALALAASGGAHATRPTGLVPAIIAAPADPLGDVARREAAEGHCRPNARAGEVVVCGPNVRGAGYRIPYEPEPGERVRLIAGEPPSARAALDGAGCLRLCEQPVMINVFSAVSAVAHGIDRLLHPD